MAPPPAGAPDYIMRHRDTEVHGPSGFPSSDILEIYAFHVDWTTPANSTFTKLPDIVTAEFELGFVRSELVLLHGHARRAAGQLVVVGSAP